MALTTKEFRRTTPRRRLLLVAAAVVAVAGVVAVVAAGGDDSSAATDMSTGQAVPGAQSSSGTAIPLPTTPAKGSLVPPAPVPERSAANADWLTAAPLGISWQRVDGVPLPFSASDGPTRIDGAVASGYSHTPQGAALACVQISMRMLYSPDFAAVIDRQTVFEPTERTQLLAARAAQPHLDPQAVAASTLQPKAFKIGAYTDSAATVYFAYPTQAGTYRIARMAVAWVDGDWKYTNRLSPDAPDLPDTGELPGFTDI